jgi:hypothetical protein
MTIETKMMEDDVSLGTHPAWFTMRQYLRGTRNGEKAVMFTIRQPGHQIAPVQPARSRLLKSHRE